MRERDIEKKMKDQVEGMGGLFYKFTSPGNAGVPDRIAVLPGGQIWFIELKAETGVASQLQLWQMGRLVNMGCNVVLIKGVDDLIDWCIARGKELELDGV